MSARIAILSATAALFAVGAQASPPPPRAATSVSTTGFESSAWPRDHGFVLLSPDSESVEMSGSMEDVRRARSLRAGGEALLYVRQGGSAYVVRDAATLRKVRSLFAPQEALGARQAELGSRQAALGRRQAALGAQQAALGRRQADSAPTVSVELVRQQGELGRRQGDLGGQQAALGRQQAELGREQARLARIAENQMQALFDEALRSGLAQRVE